MFPPNVSLLGYEMKSFSAWFESAATTPGQPPSRPHAWQQQLADAEGCADRLIRIPTGLGKTLGVLLAWGYHRLHCQDPRWPRRLVWCLPMRTLVDQTVSEAEGALARAGLSDSVDVHRLMGGIDETRWYAEPERPKVLVGTQDMLLSRALNRGYAMGRAAWPRAFGMLNSDALWVMDEIQLMGVGLTTSAQIQAFWEDERAKWDGVVNLPRATWWMSATLQPDWLRSPETEERLPKWKSSLLTVATADRVGPQWDAKKPLSIESLEPTQWGSAVVNVHRRHDADPQYGRQTLVVVNRVKQAKELFAAIDKILKAEKSRPELRLVHSRFRPHDRAGWTTQFLSKKTLGPDIDRIIIATQVVEAGVDISASCLISELAPWPCLVQRFGRAARYGGKAEVIVLDPSASDEKQAAPYALDELNSARESLSQLPGAAITDLENFEAQLRASDPEKMNRLFPFQPLHVLMRHEFDELFDTSPDLSGGDVDVSRFIREGEDQRDLQVFWRHWEGWRPPAEIQPVRDELCSVSIGEARAWVAKVTKNARGKVWAWDYVAGLWQESRGDALRPGMVLLVQDEVGGYDPLLGFTGDAPKKGALTLDLTSQLEQATNLSPDLTDGADGASESDSIYKTIATHSYEAAECGIALSRSIGFDESWCRLIGIALRLHDWGKAHPAFAKGTYRVDPPRTDLAKAPREAWPSPSQMYAPDRLANEGEPRFGKRAGFRHELVSALAALELLYRTEPDHPAFHGNQHNTHRDLPDETTQRQSIPSRLPAPGVADFDVPLRNNPVASELASLSPVELNLVLFLIASHHGKVRLSLQASPADQQFPIEYVQWVGSGMPIRGVREGDPLPGITLSDSDGSDVSMPDLTISLAPAAIGLSERYGPSWSERMLDLVSSFSPFWLGYLEALVRAVDARASAFNTSDKRLASVAIKVAQLEDPREVLPNATADATDNDEQDSLRDEHELRTTDV